MDGENAIIVRNLVKHYEGFTLNNISFEIPRDVTNGLRRNYSIKRR